MTVHVHIERLVLDGLGVEAASGARVRDAVSAEIARLVVAGELPVTARAVPHLRAAHPVDLTDRPGPEALGARIASAAVPAIPGAT
ncbi:hypothetical protein [Actinomycetospora cinnamomea]|uniref:Uncharacterized protein n=1 Tax=Actinomycetospora cinnamomea TaxID=663609 RepID=A0A2U1F7P4_9PSEU|nr:hypothetical protein [Actinomycetospora cinnamomea]PVZ08196.1 hypothetical protein C8D89_10979 [Actinomycetospora cinnamomea]